jgi:uncharacterized protein YciI
MKARTSSIFSAWTINALPGVQEADRKLVGSAFIVHAEKIEDVRAFIEVDPYWKNDVVRVPSFRRLR